MSHMYYIFCNLQYIFTVHGVVCILHGMLCAHVVFFFFESFCMVTCSVCSNVIIVLIEFSYEY